MAIIESVSRLAANFIAIIQTRLELAAVEIEEESLRLFSYLLFALLAVFCLSVAVLLGIFLVVALYWETHRVPVLIGLIAFFGLTGILIVLRLRHHYRSKPRLLSHTFSELTKDIDGLKSASESTS